MNTTKVCDNTYRFSVNAEPNSLLFESLWPIPEGVSMNSYIVKGDKTAIIDGVCGWDGVPESLLDQLKKAEIALEDIDYVVINHMEPDHSEWLKDFAAMRSDFKIYTHQKSKILLERLLDVTQEIHAVKTGDTLDLGQGHVLSFVEIPNVHWPETIATFDTKTKTLFSCDAFGSFKSVPDDLFTDSMSSDEIADYENETLRYYANIIGAFSAPVKSAVKKLVPLGDISTIAPGHGLIWRENTDHIVDLYSKYAAYSNGPAEKAVTIIWASMYGNTGKAVPEAVKALEEEGVQVFVHKVPESHISYIIRDVWQSSGVIIAGPTYEYKLFPGLVSALDELGKKKAKNRKAFHFGSYGWKSGSQAEIDEINERLKMKWEFLEPVTFIGSPSEDDISVIRSRCAELAHSVIDWIAETEQAS